MPETRIPVTYAGGVTYSLIFRQTDEGFEVRRDYLDVWKPVATVQMAPLERDPDLTEVIINGDLKHGVPFFVWMNAAGVEVLKGLRG